MTSIDDGCTACGQVSELSAVSVQEQAARAITARFPGSILQIPASKVGDNFEIYFQGKLLLVFDKKGTRYHFPSRRKRNVKWDKVTTFGLPRVIDFILRDLAEADYEVLSSTQKKILKRPIHISRYMRCPECKEGGGIKIILRADSLPEENSQLYTAISRDVDVNGAEIQCTLCHWIGIREQLLQKRRRARKR